MGPLIILFLIITWFFMWRRGGRTVAKAAFYSGLGTLVGGMILGFILASAGALPGMGVLAFSFVLPMFAVAAAYIGSIVGLAIALKRY